MWPRDRLTVAPAGAAVPEGVEHDDVVTPRELKDRARTGQLLRDVQRYQCVQWVVDDVCMPSRPFVAMGGGRFLGRRADLVDARGGVRAISTADVARAGVRFARDVVARHRFERSITADVDLLLSLSQHRRSPRMGRDGPIFVRPDFTRGLVAGGSVGHIAGVLNNFAAMFAEGALPGPPVFVSCDRIPTLSEEVEAVLVPPGNRFWDFGELPFLDLNRVLRDATRRVAGGRRPAFLYHRYGLFHFATAAYAREHDLPLVLEYNGSEVWIAENWGGGVQRRALAEKIEVANLAAADLVVVVSEPLRIELVDRGVPPERILVNPNGVDPARYRPDIDGTPIREELHLGDRVVVGFIGTFGRWHGAEVLAAAVGELVRRRPDLRNSVRFLMIGDGVSMPLVREALRRDGTEDLVALTGLVPQQDGPALLAAADILASPHVPNADGTPFIGSPTKLFEYLAMGRAIVASDLDQIGEVLDREIAVLVPPGDAVALAEGIARLVDDRPLRHRLAAAARKRAVARHTWRIHTQHIVEALEAVVR